MNINILKFAFKTYVSQFRNWWNGQILNLDNEQTIKLCSYISTIILDETESFTPTTYLGTMMDDMLNHLIGADMSRRDKAIYLYNLLLTFRKPFHLSLPFDDTLNF